MKIKLDQKKRYFFCRPNDIENKEQKQRTEQTAYNPLNKSITFFNGFNIFLYLSRDITVFPFLSFMFSSESQVQQVAFCCCLLDTFLSVWQSFMLTHD